MENDDLIRDFVKKYIKSNFDKNIKVFDPKNPVVRLHEPSYNHVEIMAALDVLMSTEVTLGRSGYVEEFEKEFARRYGYKYAVMVNSGSSANLLAISAMCSYRHPYFKKGDCVIVPALCWSTSVWPIIQNGLHPVIVDINPSTLNIDCDCIYEELLENEKLKGMLIVHVYGNPCNMDKIKEICEKYDLKLIEDCCEALGSYRETETTIEYVGSTGIINTFSFYFSHHITTFEGGMCVTNYPHIYETMKMMRSHGWNRDVSLRYHDKDGYLDPKFTFVDLGYNIRPTEIQGAVGLKQINRVNPICFTRNINYNAWAIDFHQEPLINFFDMQELEPNKYRTYNSSFGFICILKNEDHFTVKEIRDFLKSKNVETRPIICGNIARQPALRQHLHFVSGDNLGLKCADHVMKCGFSWGNHHYIDHNARSYINECLLMFLKQKGLIK